MYIFTRLWCRNVFVTDGHAHKSADLGIFDHIQVTYGERNKKKSNNTYTWTYTILTPGKSLIALSLNGMNCTGYKPVHGERAMLLGLKNYI